MKRILSVTMVATIVGMSLATVSAQARDKSSNSQALDGSYRDETPIRKQDMNGRATIKTRFVISGSSVRFYMNSKFVPTTLGKSRGAVAFELREQRQGRLTRQRDGTLNITMENAGTVHFFPTNLPRAFVKSVWRPLNPSGRYAYSSSVLRSLATGTRWVRE